jgi:hypothetical protein
MYTEKIKIYQRFLKEHNTPASPEKLKEAYKKLCQLERVKKGKAVFYDSLKHTGKHFKDFQSGKYLLTTYNFIFFAIKKRRLYIEPRPDWILILFHELTHQILMDEMNYSGHGVLFQKLHIHLLDQYYKTFLEYFKKPINS